MPCLIIVTYQLIHALYNNSFYEHTYKCQILFFFRRNPDENVVLKDHVDSFEKAKERCTNEENTPNVVLTEFPGINHLQNTNNEEFQEPRMLSEETRALTASELLLNK